MSPIGAVNNLLANGFKPPAPAPQPLKLDLPPGFATDGLALSGRLAADRQADAIFDQVLKQPEGPGPVSIQSLSYTDTLTGRDATLVFGADPGQVVPPVQMPPPPLAIDPRTGQPDLQLKTMRLRLNMGRYDMMVTVDGNGRPHLGNVFEDGRAVPELLRDALKSRLESDPAVWGPIAGAALVGVGVLAANQAKKSGKPVDFDLGRVKLLSGESYDVKAKVLGEFRGGSGRPGMGGVELGASYHDGPWEGSLTAKQRRGADPEYGMSASYEVSKSARWVATASYNQRTRTSAYVGFNATF